MERTMAAGARAGRVGGSARAPRRRGAWRGLPTPGAALAARPRRALARLLAALRTRRHLRIALLCALIALPVLGGAWLWLRHSSFVAVEHVRITGAHGHQAGAIDSALTEAAKGMSTLDVQRGELKAAVARFPEVAAIHVTTSFPHAMRIAVVERTPVAALLVGGTRIAVGSDGVALGTGVQAGSLPAVADDVAPPSGERARNPLVLQALAVLGAAPHALDRFTTRAYFSSRGLTVAMRTGLLVYFGDSSRPHAKWLALASVLSDPSSAGALYVDVRTPERAAAGYAAGSGPAEAQAGANGEAQIGKGESTVAALAAGLAAAIPETHGTSGAEASEEPSEEASGGAGSSPAGEAGGGVEAEGASSEAGG